MKFIMLLRDPVEQFQLNYQFRMHYNFTGYTRDSLAKFVNMSFFEINSFCNSLLKQRLQHRIIWITYCACLDRMLAIYEVLYPVHIHLVEMHALLCT